MHRSSAGHGVEEMMAAAIGVARRGRSAAVLAWLCLVVGAAAVAGTNRWTGLGPQGAEVRAIQVDPMDPTRLVAGTADAGVFVSFDQASSWSWRGPEETAVNTLALHPTDPMALYLATSTDGVLVSRDGGQSWDSTNQGLPGSDVRAVLIDPVTPTRLWAGGPFGVYRSSDGGATWGPSGNGLPPTLVTALAMDPTNPMTLYAGGATAGVYKSVDGGESWQQAGAGLGDLRVLALAVNPRSPSSLLAATEGGLYASSDGGGSWSLANNGLEGRVVRAVLFDPFLAGGALAATDAGVFRTTNSGASWVAVSGPAGSASAYALAADRSLVPTIYAGTSAGVFVSGDGGLSFEAANTGLSSRRISGVAFDPSGAGTLLAGCADGRLFSSPFSPVTWHEESGLAGSSVVLPVVAGGVWYAGTGNGVYVKTTPSGTWTSLGPAGTVVTALAVAGTTPPTLHVGTASGVRTSTDGGSTWGPVRLEGVAIRALAVDPATPSRVVAATSNGVYVTQNHGSSWTRQSSGLTTNDVTDVAIHPANPLNLWAATATAGVFRSSDGGTSWSVASTGLRGTQVRRLAVDPTNASVLLAAVAGHGVFCSTDLAASWIAVNEALPTPQVWAAAVLPNGTWVAGTSVGAFAFTPAIPSGSLRQLVLDTGGWPWTGREVGANPGQRFVWLNRFSPAPEDFPLYLTKIALLFPAGVSAGRPLDLVVLRDLQAGPVFTQRVTVQVADGATWNEYLLAQPLLLQTAGDVLVGAVDRGEANSNLLVGLYDVNAPTGQRAWAGQYAGDPGSPLTWPPSTVWGYLDTPYQVYAFAIRATALRASAPTIASVSPAGGLTSGGTSVVIRGSGFLQGAAVSFGGVPATAVAVLNGATITAVTPPHAAGVVDVRVANSDGQSATLPGGFVYFQAPTLALTPAAQTVPMGGKGTITVTLGGPAPVDLTVDLNSATPWVATVPGFVHIAAGTSSADVQVNGISPGGPVTVTASLPPEAGGASATAQVTVVARYVVPSVAHNSGMAGSRWFTDLAVVNRGSAAASLTLVYAPKSGTAVTRTHTLQAAGTVEWRNVLETLFGIAASAESQGVVEVTASQALAISSRTYNRSSTGTFGQNYPALTVQHAIGSDEIAYLPQLKKTAEFRTNVGIVNLGSVPCTVRFAFFAADGSPLGEKNLTAQPGRWEQQADVFANIGVTTVAIAYATVDVVSEGGFAWAYASVIDARTNDPTTVPMLTRSEMGPPIGIAGTYVIPSVAHNKGLAGSRWFTDLAVVNTADSPTGLTLRYSPRGSGEPVSRSVELGPRGTLEWQNVLETLFGVAAEAESQGVVVIESGNLLAVSSRTYNRSATGTFGQSYPAIIERHGIAAGSVAVLPGLKKSSAFRTNVGVVNLGPSQCRLRFRLYDGTGSQVGETVVTAAAGQWEQVNDVFQVVGAGNREPAYATAEVLSPTGLAWAYASVIDSATNDPTTVPMVR